MVKGDDGKPIAGAFVAVTKQDNPVRGFGGGAPAATPAAASSDGTVEASMDDRTDDQGRFTVENVPAGSYTVVVWFANGYQGYGQGDESALKRAVPTGSKDVELVLKKLPEGAPTGFPMPGGAGPRPPGAGGAGMGAGAGMPGGSRHGRVGAAARPISRSRRAAGGGTPGLVPDDAAAHPGSRRPPGGDRGPRSWACAPSARPCPAFLGGADASRAEAPALAGGDDLDAAARDEAGRLQRFPGMKLDRHGSGSVVGRVTAFVAGAGEKPLEGVTIDVVGVADGREARAAAETDAEGAFHVAPVAALAGCVLRARHPSYRDLVVRGLAVAEGRATDVGTLVFGAADVARGLGRGRGRAAGGRGRGRGRAGPLPEREPRPPARAARHRRGAGPGRDRAERGRRGASSCGTSRRGATCCA